MTSNQLPRSGEKIFNKHTIENEFYRQRKKLVYKLNNPRLLKIHMHTFRHWHGTTEYHKTHNLEHVQKRLGHKNIKNTMVYIHCEEVYYGQGSDEYIVEVTSDKQKIIKLLEVGFEFVSNFDGEVYLRKRK